MDEEHRSHRHYKDLISTLPLKNGLRCYHGFWFPDFVLPSILSLHHCFKASPTDIFLVTYPKSGTTWLKALGFAVINRRPSSLHNNPLLTTQPHDCVPHFERLFATDRVPDLDVLPPRRLLGTHLPYSLLPDSVKDSGCRIVYLCRDPKDTLVSMWHFAKEIRWPEAVEAPPVPSLDQVFEYFCDGAAAYGPLWDHHLEYWRESLRQPEKVLFLKYEELKEKPEENVRKLAEFLGQPFSPEEEKEGLVGEIVRLCSFEFLKGLDVNRVGLWERVDWAINNSAFFRKGEVGGWKEHLSLEMAAKLDGIIQQKLDGSGL